MSQGPHGLLVIDKPRGITSHDAVAQARRLYRTRSVGHAGTLDPMATGVLVLLFGEGCKLSSYLSADDKSYLTTLRFGVATDSFDADGSETARQELAPDFPDPARLEQALATERERTLQVPPSVSAIHDRGVRAHVRVRRGEALELPPRPIHVHALELVARRPHEVDLALTVSKGFYVRALARDLGEQLGAPVHLSALRRSASGAFRLSEAVAWPCEAPAPLLPLQTAAARALPTTQLSDDGVRCARQGKRLQGEQASAATLDCVSAWFAPDGALVALGTSHADGTHQVVRGFASGSEATPD
ncbi:MAG: tRNA pseudouridine(55) synthase TruB [Polyangiaceae bacterium]